MAEPLEESLSFDISDALSGIQSISDALDQVVAGFATGLAAALETLTAVGADVTPLAETLDVAGLGTAIDSALSAVDTPIQVEGDASGLEQSISIAIDAPQPPVDVEGDASQVTDAIDAATAVEPTIDVTADTSAAQQAIDGLDNEPVTLDVDADTSAAQDQIDGLSQSVSGLGKSSSSGGEQLAGLEGAVLGLKAATGGAQGEVGGLSEGIGSIGGSTAIAVGGLAVLGGFIGETTKLAADAQAQNKRFADTFGNLAEQVQQINVGGLNISLDQLGKTSGTTAADLDATASRIGLLGQSSGASNATIVSTTQNLLALGATIAVNNPRLGDAASVTDRLTNAFARGGRALAPFGIALSSAQINAEALNETGKTTAADLTLFEKSTAGATLALATFGDTLGTRFQQGAQNAQVQLGALKAQLEETLIAVGGPLLEPLVASLSDLLPVAEQVGIALGKLAGDILPLIADIAPVLTPVAAAIGLIADGLGALGPAGIIAVGALSILVPDLVLVASGFTSATLTATAFGVALDFATGPIGALALGLGLLGELLRTAGDGSSSMVTDVSDLSTALTDASKGIDGATAAVDAYLKKQLAVSVDGQSGLDIANQLGVGYDQLTNAITGTQDQYEKFSSTLFDSLTPQEQNSKAVNHFFDVLDNGQSTLQDNAKLALEAAVANGTLTKSQLAAAEASHQAQVADELTGKNAVDFLVIQKQLGPEIAKNAKAQQDATDAAVAGSGAQKDITQQVADGTIVLKDATNVAKEYGLSIDKATEIIQNAEAAQDQHAQAVDRTSHAYLSLTNQIALGTVNELDAQFALRTMGFTADGAKAEFTALQKAVEDFVKSALNGLPGVADAAKNLGKSDDPQKFIDNLNKQAFAIASFQTNLQKLVTEGFGHLAGQLTAIPIDVAGPLAAKLSSNESQAKLAQAGITLAQTVTSNFADFADSHAAALGVHVGDAAAGGVPLGVDQQTGAIAQAGQSAAATLAAHFHPDFSKPVSVGIAAAQQALTADTSIGQAAGEAGIQAVQAYEANFGPLTTANATKIAIDAAAQAIQTNPSLASAASAKGTETAGAYKPDIAGAASQAFATGAGTIQTLTSTAVAAGRVGFATGVAFDSGLAEGLSDPSSIGGVTSAAAAVAGAAAQAAKDKLKVKSPSQVAIGIGQDFTKGLALGLVDGTAGVDQSATVIAAELVTKLQEQLAAGIAKISQSTAVAQALTAFATSATSHLPTIGGDISAFSSNLNAALAAQQAALAGVHKAYDTYHNDLAKTRADQAAQAAAAVTLAAAQKKLAEDTAAGASKLQIKIDTTAVSKAQSVFDSFTNSLKSAQSAQDSAVQNIGDAAKTLSDAGKALAAASSPGLFISNLNKQTQASQRFLEDITKLKNEGFVQLANELLQAGPDAAGKLADAFAGSAGKAKQANAAIVAADTFAKTYTAEIEKLFGAPQVKAAATAAGQTIGLGVNSGLSQVIKFDPGATNKLTVPSLSAPLQKVMLPPGVVGASGVNSIDLNLNITIPDGTTKTAQVTIPVRVVGQTLKQLTVAEVKAS